MITYKIRSGKTNKTQQLCYFAVVNSRGFVDFEKIAAEIAAKSTTTRADVAAVLMALEEIIPQKLSDTHSVRLGRLGSFRPTIRSNGKGCSEKKDVTANNISRVSCRFLPGTYLRRELELQNLTFSRQVDRG